ncbi:MAG: hypothetical protein PHV30_03950 [Candidatus Margulisbacteria bacterium]|nr:hypothetical protein [Candidatus Margulisiibacteriota bacterium]
MKRIIILLSLLCGFNVFALQISLDPPHYNVLMKQGSAVRKTLTLTNQGKENLNVKVYLNDWYMQDGKKVFIQSGMTAYSLKNSCLIFPSSFSLKAKESRTVILTLTSAANETGGQYGVIFFEAYPLVSIKNSGVSFGGRIGSMIYKEIDGQVSKVYNLKNLKTSLVGNKLYYEYALTNEGNVLLQPKCTIVLMDNKTNEVYLKEDLKDVVIALPKDTFTKKGFTVLNKVPEKKDNLSLLLTLDFGDDNIIIKEIKVNE